jgi:hypothetical protein
MNRLGEHADNVTRDNARKTGRPCTLPASFYAFIDGTIPTCVSPDDRTTALLVVRKLTKAKQKCKGDFALSRNEHTRLGRLIKKWEARAQGKDPRFQIMGTRLGHPTDQQKAKMEKLGWVSSHVPVQEPRVYNKTCLECGGKFEAHRKDRLYCQPLCRGRRFERLKRKQHPWRDEPND